MENFLFYPLTITAVASALWVVISKRPVYGVLALVVTMFSLSGLFALLGAYFVAAIQILIYAGAILVLFLFVLMLLGLDKVDLDFQTRSHLKLGVVWLILFSFLSEFLIFIAAFKETDRGVGILGTVEAIGQSLLTEHLLAFELISLILLVGVIGVVHLSKKEGAR